MEIASTNKKLEINTKANTFCMPDQTFEVAVIDDNKLINMILLSKALDATINRIRSLKKFAIKFSSFKNGTDFLTYLDNKEFGNSKLIVFSDYYLEENVNGDEILKKIKQKDIDSTVIIMSDTTNKQTSVDTVNMGAHCFLPKDKKTPFICSEILSQMVI